MLSSRKIREKPTRPVKRARGNEKNGVLLSLSSGLVPPFSDEQLGGMELNAQHSVCNVLGVAWEDKEGQHLLDAVLAAKDGDEWFPFVCAGGSGVLHDARVLSRAWEVAALRQLSSLGLADQVQ